MNILITKEMIELVKPKEDAFKEALEKLIEHTDELRRAQPVRLPEEED